MEQKLSSSGIKGYNIQSGRSLKWTPSGREKGVRNWSCWPLTGMKNTEFVWELRKTGFCEGGRK